MLCCHCKKNQASKTYEKRKIVAQKTVKTTEYYCLECYRRLFVSVSEENAGRTVCPSCGMTAAAFKQKKLVGCAKCYFYLSDTVLPVVLKMQGAAEAHCGKEETASDIEKLVKRAHEVQILLDKKKTENAAAAKVYEREIAALRADIAAMKKGELT